MRLFLIRHGEMAGDPYCHPGRPVSGCLSGRGQVQAAATARALAGPWHAVLASPYGRALQTAEIVCGVDQAITILDCLEEWHPDPGLRAVSSTAYEAMIRRDADLPAEATWKTAAGEGCYDMYARIVPGVLGELDRLGVRCMHGGFCIDPALESARIAIVAHGGTLNILLSHLLGVRPFPVGTFAFSLAAAAELVFSSKAGVSYPQLVIPGPGHA